MHREQFAVRLRPAIAYSFHLRRELLKTIHSPLAPYSVRVVAPLLHGRIQYALDLDATDKNRALTIDYLAELTDAYLEYKKETGELLEALRKALDAIPEYAEATQMGRELTVKLLHEDPTLAVNAAKEI